MLDISSQQLAGEHWERLTKAGGVRLQAEAYIRPASAVLLRDATLTESPR